jgi:hypothetical protein
MGADGGKSKGAEDALATSRQDAQVLLWFAARAGKKVEPKVLESMVTADSDLTAKGRKSGTEARFWTAYRDLAAAVKPASVESILSTWKHPFGEHGQEGNEKLGNARKTKSRYTTFALVVLFLLLIFRHIGLL